MTAKQFVQPSKYRILGLVGRGQFGRVFCARHRKTGGLVALKELDQQRFPTSQLLRELRFLLSLQHENIVSYIALEHSRGTRYLVMEYCEAGTLRDVMNPNYQLGLGQSLQLVIDILAGLENAHKSNIVHCDVKPENVLLRLTPTGWRAKVSDFGIARLSQEIEKSGATGSPGYMAPERFYGQFSVSSDLYAVGVILYELLCQERPFSGKPSELMVAHLNQRVEIPDRIPVPLQAILIRALQKLPGKRYANASQMRQELLSVMSSEEFASYALEMSLDRNLDPDVRSVPNADNSIDLPASSSECIAQQSFEARIVALAGDGGSYIYSALRFQLQRHPLSNPAQSEPLLKFNTDITNLSIENHQKFVATSRSVYRLAEKNTAIFRFNQDFLWTISPQANWAAASIDHTLEVKNLVYGKVKKLSFGDEKIKAIATIDRHHLAVISQKPDATGSKITVVSRRGNVMGNFLLPVSIAQAKSSSIANRLLLIEQQNPMHLLLVDLKPFRLSQVVLDFTPTLVATAGWGYAIAGQTDPVSSESGILGLYDSNGQSAGRLNLDGTIASIAPISNHLFAVSTHTATGGKFYLIDLKQLDVELIF